MKNLSFLLLVFPGSISNSLPAQAMSPTLKSDTQRDIPDQSTSHNSKKGHDNVEAIQGDTLSNADRLTLSAKYQSLDHSPNNMVMTNEGQTYTWSAKGINFWDGTSKISITTENARIPENNITALALDTDDNLWIGTHSKGIVKGIGYPVKPFKTKLIKTHDLSIYSIVAEVNGGMWVTFQDGGYEYFQNGISSAYFPGQPTK